VFANPKTLGRVNFAPQQYPGEDDEYERDEDFQQAKQESMKYVGPTNAGGSSTSAYREYY
jgi:hypothetical protein